MKEILLALYVTCFFFVSSAWAQDFDSKLDHAFSLRTSDIPAYTKTLVSLEGQTDQMSHEQKCYFDFLNAQLPYYQGDYQTAIAQNKEVIKNCSETAYIVYSHTQDAVIYSATSDYVKAFESLQAAEKNAKKIILTEQEKKHYLSGSIMVLVNLAQYDLAESKLLELEKIAKTPNYLCRLMFNRLNIALAEQNHQYSSEARLQEVTENCSLAGEQLYLQFSQTVWHYFKFIDKEVSSENVEVWLANHLLNEPDVVALNYPYLSSAYYATLAQGYKLLGDAANAKSYAQKSLSFESLGNVIFKVTAMDVMIAELAAEGDYQQAFSLLQEKSAIEQVRQFELKQKNMAYSLVEQAIDAKENTIRLLNEQNAILLHNEELKDEQNALQKWLITSLVFSLVLILLFLWRLWLKLKDANLKSHLDYLTKTANRKGFEKQLQAIFERHDVVHTEVQFGLMNLDDFRQVNDELGHHAGDFLLIDLVKRCESMLPENAFMGRTGGEEFSFVLYNASSDDMKNFLNMMREHIMNQKFIYHQDEMNLTASFGFTSAKPGMGSYEKLIGPAEKALYQAKILGKNQVVYS